MDLEPFVLIVAGGLFGVILGKALDEAPRWVFWALLAVFLGALIYVASA